VPDAPAGAQRAGSGTKAPLPSRERSARPGEGRSTHQGTGRRALLFAITLALPFVLLALVEAGLRIGGYGHDLEPLFIPAPGRPEYRQANPDAVKRLFADPAQAPHVSIETAYFRSPKPPGTFRVIVQGASSAAGFPYGLGASPAGMLEQRLRRAYPDRDIEVISTAMAAVNTYALDDFVSPILAEQPDAIVIYVGHNEYLGILGVGSTLRFASTPWITRAFLAVRGLRLFQLMSALMTPRVSGSTTTDPSDTLMAVVAGERSIPLDSTLYERGLEQYRHNLDTLLARYRAAGVPVFIGTVASNERDQAPFSGQAARDEFEAAKRLEADGKFLEARAAYQHARDLDELRFRAPTAFNAIVRDLAARHGATVVDCESALALASEHGIIGRDVMLEHVHPNLDGYFRLADSFYDALVASGLLGPPEVEIDDAAARAEIPVSDIDRWLGEYKIARIRNGWPFRAHSRPTVLPAPATEAERLAQQLYHEDINWPQAQDALRRYYETRGNVAGVARVSQILADAFPFVPTLQFDAARALIALARPRDALRYSRRGIVLAPADVNLQLVHAHASALAGHTADAHTALDRVLELDPGNETARRAREQLH
jgi:tetratricopeptide (TPR) repeat protein